MNHHLPAGQPMPGGVGGMGGGRGLVDMGSGPGPHAGNGPRRRPQYSHQQHSYTHHNHNQPIYYQNSHMNPYANAYYPQAPPHYPNAGMPGSPYGMPSSPHGMAYNPYATRSPPAMHQQYAPIVSSSMAHTPHVYARPPQQQPSPAISTPPPPYHMAQPPPPPPPAAAPVPQTPSSTHSSQAVQGPLTPTTPQSQEPLPQPPSKAEVAPAKAPFKYPLPWLSDPNSPFPTRAARSRRRRRILTSTNGGVELPANQQAGIETLDEPSASEAGAESTVSSTPTQPPTVAQDVAERPETPSTQDLPSEGAQSTSPTTPASVDAAQPSTVTSVTPTQPSKPASKAAVPAVPVVPILPKSSPKETRPAKSTEKISTEQKQTVDVAAEDTTNKPDEKVTTESSEPKAESTPVPAWTAPKSWASLLASNASNAAAAATRGVAATAAVNGSSTSDGAATGDVAAVPSFTKSNASSQAEALHNFRVSNGAKLAFVEPRGLINTGNMCYMNSVLQVLIFCIPFYDFLDQVSKKAAHSFNSETPLIDAMIMFMREYKVIDSAASVDQLRRRLKNEELEQYGEPFTPEFVYEAIRKLPRFASMRRGHQQDAEEFLGFLLEALHDECANILRHLPETPAVTTGPNSSVASPTAASPAGTDSDTWLEVGRKQRAAVTRSSGHPITSSPITRIFGGQLRSELRVSGLKDSVTLEPYQPLQLDIDSPQVRNIVDALKNITRSETLTGDFGSPRGDAVAHKQVFIESLPPVLILHLKRFQFDAKGGTMKIWKKVGYPLELEIPAEVVSRQKRAALVHELGGMPKYKLIAAVYHHGKNASGGHYTVDVRRQDGREWVRIDDTVIRRVRSEDVAEGGAEEDKKNWSDEKKEAAVSGTGNRFEGIGDDTGDEEGWNKVSAPAGGAKKWSSIVNGNANPVAPAAPKPIKDNKADNKVAYLLFYQRV